MLKYGRGFTGFALAVYQIMMPPYDPYYHLTIECRYKQDKCILGIKVENLSIIVKN